VKLLSWKWFLDKNFGPLVPFTSGVSTLLYVGTGRVCLDVMLGLDNIPPFVVMPDYPKFTHKCTLSSNKLSIQIVISISF
jgi:hypothetical protein